MQQDARVTGMLVGWCVRACDRKGTTRECCAVLGAAHVRSECLIHLHIHNACQVIESHVHDAGVTESAKFRKHLIKRGMPDAWLLLPCCALLSMSLLLDCSGTECPPAASAISGSCSMLISTKWTTCAYSSTTLPIIGFSVRHGPHVGLVYNTCMVASF